MTPTYLISLLRDAQRRQTMTAQLERMGLPFEWFEAILGQALPAAELEACIDHGAQQRGYHQKLTPGEIGCYLSHLGVWQRLLDSDRGHALVLEDDVTLLPSLPAVLQSVPALTNRWDMIKLIGRPKEQPLRGWPLPQQGAGELIRYARVPTMTSAYLISREGASKLLELRKRFFRPIDIDLRHWWEGELRMYGVLPYPVVLSEASQTSSIGHREPEPSWSRMRRKVTWRLFYNLNNFSHNRRIEAAADPFIELTGHRTSAGSGS